MVSNQRGILPGLYTTAVYLAFRSKTNWRVTHTPGQLFSLLLEGTALRLSTSLSDIEFSRRQSTLTDFLDGDRILQKPGNEAASNRDDLRFASHAETENILLSKR